MAEKNYAFSLPSPAAGGINVAYLLPIDDRDARVNVTAVYSHEVETVSNQLIEVRKNCS